MAKHLSSMTRRPARSDPGHVINMVHGARCKPLTIIEAVTPQNREGGPGYAAYVCGPRATVQSPQSTVGA